MGLKDTSQYKQLKEAMDLIHKLKIPENLQQKALEHLLSGGDFGLGSQDKEIPGVGDNTGRGTTGNLRTMVHKVNPKGAVAEIPFLLYWSKGKEKREIANEKDIVELYRRAGIRPPKNIAQSLRDLSSKKYGRLESVKDNPGYVRLSRSGEDFVLYDLIEPTQTQ